MISHNAELSVPMLWAINVMEVTEVNDDINIYMWERYVADASRRTVCYAPSGTSTPT
jgi:hypothetical protein